MITLYTDALQLGHGCVVAGLRGHSTFITSPCGKELCTHPLDDWAGVLAPAGREALRAGGGQHDRGSQRRRHPRHHRRLHASPGPGVLPT